MDLNKRLRYEDTFYWQGKSEAKLQDEAQCTSGEDWVQGAVPLPLQVNMCFKFLNSLTTNEDTLSQFESKYTVVCY